MPLGTIKKRIHTNANILKITKSLKVMSLTRLKTLTQQKNVIKQSLVKIEEICKEQLSESRELEEEEKKEYILNLFIFTDMIFCGNLNKAIEHRHRTIVSNISNTIIIGSKGKHLTGKFLGKLYDKHLLDSLYNTIVDYFRHIRTIDGEYILRIYMLDNIYNLHYKFYEQRQEAFNGYFKYLLQDHLVMFQKEESHVRLIKLTSAIDNSEELEEELKMYYNKTRQMLITAELLETIASSVSQT